MSKEGEFEELRVHVSRLRQKGYVLRMYQLSFVVERIARLLFST
jgi:hypothetical protein